MALEIAPFQTEFLPQAAELLARRHRSDRIARPDLPPRFENPAGARQALEATWRRPYAGGFAALEDEQLVAYLLGEMVFDPLWGRAGWVRLPGCACEPAAGVEIIRDLYAALGARWVAHGVFSHFVLTPVSNPALINVWFTLGFGLQQIHGLVDLKTLDPARPSHPARLEIRRAGPEDRSRLVEMAEVIWRSQLEAPVWAIQLPETTAENRADWAALVDKEEVIVWLAFEADELAGFQAYWPAEPADDKLLTPDRTIELVVAGTRETARGRGVGRLLTGHGLAQARSSGYHYGQTDWRSANLLASRFWPRRGFRPAAYRLARRVDERIAWARGNLQMKIKE